MQPNENHSGSNDSLEKEFQALVQQVRELWEDSREPIPVEVLSQDVIQADEPQQKQEIESSSDDPKSIVREFTNTLKDISELPTAAEIFQTELEDYAPEQSQQQSQFEPIEIQELQPIQSEPFEVNPIESQMDNDFLDLRELSGENDWPLPTPGNLLMDREPDSFERNAISSSDDLPIERFESYFNAPLETTPVEAEPVNQNWLDQSQFQNSNTPPSQTDDSEELIRKLDDLIKEIKDLNSNLGKVGDKPTPTINYTKPIRE